MIDADHSFVDVFPDCVTGGSSCGGTDEDAEQASRESTERTEDSSDRNSCGCSR